MCNQALIFFDIDGTLLDDDKKLPQSTQEAITQLQAEGHIIAIATGRGPFMYQSLREQLNINTFVSFNGSYVVADDQVVFKNPLNKERLLELTAEGLQNDHPSVFMSGEGMRSNIPYHPFIDQSLSTLKLDVTPGFDPDYALNHELYQSLLFIEEDAIDYYQNKFSEFDYVRWHPQSVDVLPKDGSKAKGIEAAVEALNIKSEHVYAFGDGLNDVEMLKTIKNSVAMGNGEPEAKEAAKYVTKNVDQAGIVHGLKMIGLI